MFACVFVFVCVCVCARACACVCICALCVVCVMSWVKNVSKINKRRVGINVISREGGSPIRDAIVFNFKTISPLGGREGNPVRIFTIVVKLADTGVNIKIKKAFIL